MAVSCDPGALVAAAKCFDCIPKSSRKWVELYLLAVLAKLPTTAAGIQAIVKAATCDSCVPRDMEQPVQLYELASITSTTTDAATLVRLAKCFECVPVSMQKSVELYLLAVAAGGSLDPATLVRLAACFSCVPRQMWEPVEEYLLCLITAPSGGGGTGFDAVVTNWISRVVANGGATPSMTTQQAMNVFVLALRAASIESLMISVCCFVPDSLIAATTPIYKLTGNDPWTNSGFLAADLNLNGLINNGTKFLNTGVNLVTFFGGNAPQPVGMTIYNFTPLNEAGIPMGAQDGAGHTFNFYFTFADGNTYFDCFDSANGRAMGANPLFVGMQSANRISNIRSDVYAASSTVALASVANDVQNAAANLMPNLPILYFGLNNNGVLTAQNNKRFSFGAIHKGLTQAQALSFFNAIQAFRVACGGGFV